jgi:hypothetical protein
MISKPSGFIPRAEPVCFGMDKFYVDLAPPAPSTPDAIVVGSGTVDDLTNESPETCGAEGYDIKRCWYLGAGVGAAHLNPEGRVNGWGTDSAGSLGIEVHLGQYITPK